MELSGKGTDMRHDFRLSAIIYSLECLESEGENPAIFYSTGSRVRFQERIHLTWNVLTGWSSHLIYDSIRSCIRESTDNRGVSKTKTQKRRTPGLKRRPLWIKLIRKLTPDLGVVWNFLCTNEVYHSPFLQKVFPCVTLQVSLNKLRVLNHFRSVYDDDDVSFV